MKCLNEVLVLNARTVYRVEPRVSKIEDINFANIRHIILHALANNKTFHNDLSASDDNLNNSIRCRTFKVLRSIGGVEGYAENTIHHNFVIQSTVNNLIYLARANDLAFQGRYDFLSRIGCIYFDSKDYGISPYGNFYVANQTDMTKPLNPNTLKTVMYERFTSNMDLAYNSIEWVDSIYHENRFFKIQKSYLHSILHKQSTHVYAENDYYYRCKQYKILFYNAHEECVIVDGDKYCFDAYINFRKECDICLYENRLDDLYYEEKLNRYSDDIIVKLITKSDIKKICSDCMNYIYRLCTHCGNYKHLDIDVCTSIKSKDDRNQFLHEHRASIGNSYTKINDYQYCNDCADEALTSTLYNTTRQYRTPSIHEIDKDSKIHRHCSIESEVITEYDDSDSYIDNVGELRGWKIVHDGSLSEGGIEFKHRKPLIGSNIARSIDHLEDHHYSWGNWVDSSCGIHVHFNARDFRFKEMQILSIIMNHIDDTIQESLPRERRNSSYAKKFVMNYNRIVKWRNILDLSKHYYEERNNTTIDNRRYNNARYTSTNLHARFYHGTIEFRHHEGSLDGRPIYKWVRFLYNIMQATKETANQSTNRGKRLNKILYNRNLIEKTTDMKLIDIIGGNYSSNYIIDRINNNK